MILSRVIGRSRTRLPVAWKLRPFLSPAGDAVLKIAIVMMAAGFSRRFRQQSGEQNGG
jgi:hypothetical protein